MLFLLIGFGAAILVGSLFFPSHASAPANEPDLGGGTSLGWVLWGCVVLTWLTALLPQPRWLWITHMILVTLFGLCVVAFGVLGIMVGALLDALYSGPNSRHAWLIGLGIAGTGLLILASRALAVYLRIRATSTEAPT